MDSTVGATIRLPHGQPTLEPPHRPHQLHQPLAETIIDAGTKKGPFRIYTDRLGLTVPLGPKFRFIHQPIPVKSDANFVGRTNELETLAERILFSDGGSFLVTGYRGVGKTSFVNQVVAKLKDAMPWAESTLGPMEVVDIYLNVARPLTSGELMHYVIRRLNDRLQECGIYAHLDSALQEDLSLAYQRTSVNMARKIADSQERSFGFNEASIGGDLLKAAVKMSWTSKRSRTRNVEMSFLGYDDKAAEHDILRLADRLTKGYRRPSTRWKRFWRTVRRQDDPYVRLKIVFVFDELDKLEEFTAREPNGADPKPVIDEILGSLKNLFTTSGITFVFVAGKDLQERWLEDVGRGDSVYESVFAYDKYLPCLWADVGAICDGYIDASRPLTDLSRKTFDEFKKYLAYRGRGIPRRIIRTFNEFVEWDELSPTLAFTAVDSRRIRFFAGLQDLLEKHAPTLFGYSHEEAVGTQSDRRRLGVYYLIDWILRQGEVDFGLTDVVSASSKLSLKVSLAVNVLPQVSQEIIRILLLGDYIQQVKRSVTELFIGVGHGDAEIRYRVSPRRLVEMGSSPADLDSSPPFEAPVENWTRRDVPPASFGRNRVIRELGRGGMGVVYEAIDERLNRRVAVKVLIESLASNPELVARFDREANILAALNHPSIVKLLDRGEENGRPYVVMDYLDGITLEEVIKRKGKLQLAVVADIGEVMANAVAYVHDQGVVRLDIKPNNVLITTDGQVYLLDFGISRRLDRDGHVSSDFKTQTVLMVGTPQYMAPEQFAGSAGDELSDVYAFGVTLYRMLTGVFPFSGTTPTELMQEKGSRDAVPLSRCASVPPAVDAVIMHCLARAPGERFQRMSDVASALAEAIGTHESANLKDLAKVIRKESRRVEAFDDMITAAGGRTIVDSVNAANLQYTEEIRAAPVAVAATQVAAPVAASRSGSSFDTIAPVPASAPVSSPASVPPPTQPAPTIAAPPLKTNVAGTDQDRRDAPLISDTPRPGLVLIDGPSKDVILAQGAMDAAIALTPRMTFGRNSENNVVLRDASVSRYQAVIFHEGNVWLIEDANSGNGTLLNGELVLKRTSIRDGDKIQLGIFTFQFLAG